MRDLPFFFTPVDFLFSSAGPASLALASFSRSARDRNSTSSIPKIWRNLCCAFSITALNARELDPITKRYSVHEQMFITNPVPFLLISSRFRGSRLFSLNSANRTKSLAFLSKSYPAMSLIVNSIE